MEAHFIEDIELIGSLILDKDLRLQILSKYDSIINPETRELTCNTTSDLSTLLNEQVYYTAMCATQSMDRIEFESLNNLLNKVQAHDGSQKEDEVYKALKQFTQGYTSLTDSIMGADDLITIDGVQEALKVKEPIFDDILSDIDTIDEDEIIMDADTDDSDDDQFSMDDIIEPDPEPVQVPVQENKPKFIANTDFVYEMTPKEKLLQESDCSVHFEEVAKNIRKSMEWLLSSGYSGIGQNEGVLTHRGVIFAHKNDGFIGPNRKLYSLAKKPRVYDTKTAISVYKAFEEQGVNFNKCEVNGDCTELLDPLSDEMIEIYKQNLNNPYFINYSFLVRVVRAYSSTCKGLNVGEHGTAYTFEPVGDWIEDLVVKVGYRLFKDEIDKKEYNGCGYNNIDFCDSMGEKAQLLKNLFQNAIISSRRFQKANRSSSTGHVNGQMSDEERAYLEEEARKCAEQVYGLTIKCTFNSTVGSQIDTSTLLKYVQDDMHLEPKIVIDTDNSTGKVEEIKSELLPVKLSGDNSSSGNCLQFDVIHDLDGIEQMGCLPAADALDGILNSGQKPSWSHALLGELSNGKPFFWDDFMSDKNTTDKRLYHIYAGSRSGKGILTASMLTNVLCDGYKLLYIDGKPDSGLGFGQLAWMNGKEAPIFDGARSGTGQFTPGQLEVWTNGMRDENESIQFSSEIPDFGTTLGKNQINSLITYLKGIELAFRTIKLRSSGERGDASEDWMVVVFDEIEEMYKNHESKLITVLKNAVIGAGFKFDAAGTSILRNSPTRKDAKWTDTLEWIDSFFKWSQCIIGLITSAATMDLGPSQTTIITIFQNTSWINKATSDKTSIIGAIMGIGAGKILGNRAIQNGAPADFGNGVARRSSWASWIKPLQWIMTQDCGGNVNDCAASEKSVVQFRPFSLYGYTPENKMMDGLYMVPYMRKLENKFGFSSADVLQNAWDYFENIVISKGLGSSLKEYMYYPGNFCLLDPESFKNVGGSSSDTKTSINRATNKSSGSYSDMLGLTDTTTGNNTTTNNQHDNSDGNNLNTVQSPFSNIGTPLPTQSQPNVLTNMQQAMAQQEEKTSTTQSAQSTTHEPYQINQFMSGTRLLNLIKSKVVSFSTIDNYNADIILPALFGPTDLTNTEQSVLGTGQKLPITYLDICKIISNCYVIESCEQLIIKVSSEIDDLPQGNRISKIVYDALGIMDAMLCSAYNVDKLATMIFNLHKTNKLPIDKMIKPSAIIRLVNGKSEASSAQTGQPVQPVQPHESVNQDETVDISGYDAEGFDTNGFNSSGMTREMVDNKQALENMLKQAKLQNNQAAAQSILNLLNNIQEEAIANQLGDLENFQASPEAQIEDAGIRKMPGNQIIKWLDNNDIALDAQVNDGVLRRNIQVAPDTLLVKPTGLFAKSRMKSFQNANSASYTLSKCWDNVLNEISKTFHGDNFMVKEVAISNPNIIVNKNAFNLGSALYLNNLSLEDIVSLKALFKKFPMIQKLLLDEEATNNVIYEYGEGTNAFKQMFIDNAKLRLIIITVGGRQSMITRESLVATAQFIDKEMGEVKTKQVIDAQCARLNPRLSIEDDTHILNRAHRALIGNGTDYFKKSHDVAIGDGDKKIRKWCAYTALGLGAVAISGFLGIPKIVAGWFKGSK